MLTPDEWNALGLSLRVAVFATVVTLPFGIVLGYWLARTPSRARWVVETVVNVPLVLPPVVTGFMLLVLFGRNGPIGAVLERVFGVNVAFTWIGAALASGVVAFPLMVRAIRLAFEAVNPRLELAAGSLGCGPIRTFFRVSLPLAMHGVIAGSVLAFARSVGEFGATVMLAGNIPGQTRTIPLAIFAQVQRPGGIEESWRLVVVCVLLAAVAMFVSGWLSDRSGRLPHA
jgi:molybdate transport system permease protein